MHFSVLGLLPWHSSRCRACPLVFCSVHGPCVHSDPRRGLLCQAMSFRSTSGTLLFFPVARPAARSIFNKGCTPYFPRPRECALSSVVLTDESEFCTTQGPFVSVVQEAVNKSDNSREGPLVVKMFPLGRQSIDPGVVDYTVFPERLSNMPRLSAQMDAVY